MTAAEIVLLAAKLSIAGMVFGLGLRSKPDDLVVLLERPWLLVRALIAMNLVMPLFAVTAVALLDMRLDLAVALIALSLSPVPPLLPGKASRARGDRSVAVGLLVAFAVFAIVWVPLAVHAIGALFGYQVGVSPAAIARIVATLVVAPLLLGIVLRRYAGEFARRIEPAVSKISVLVLLLAAVLIVASAAPAMLAQVGDGSVLLLAAFVVVGLAAGHWLGGPDPRERTDLALAAASRHPGIALATAQMAFPDARAVMPLVALYLIVNVLIGLPYVRWRARRIAARAGEATAG